MSSIVIENGQGLSDSNSYVTVEEIKQYCKSRGFEFADESVIEFQAIRAADYLESQNFIGIKKTYSQAMQWPRIGAFVGNFAIENTQIPKELKRAQIECVIAIEQGLDPNVTPEPAVSSESVAGAVKQSFAVREGATQPVGTPSLYAALQPLLMFGSNGVSIGAMRV